MQSKSSRETEEASIYGRHLKYSRKTTGSAINAPYKVSKNSLISKGSAFNAKPAIPAIFRWNNCGILIWKQILVQFHYPYESCFLFIFPIALIFLLTLQRMFVSRESAPIELSKRFDPDENLLTGFTLIYTIFGNTGIDELMAGVSGRLGGVPFFSALEKQDLLNPLADKFIGVIFNGVTAEDSLPDNLDFSLRFPIELRFPSDDVLTWRTDKILTQNNAFSSNGMHYNPYIRSDYFKEGFINLQSAISREFIEKKLGQPMPYQIEMRSYPFKPFTKDSLLVNIDDLYYLIFFFVSLLKSLIMLNRYASDKERHILYNQYLSGASYTDIFLAWYVTEIVLNSVMALCVAMICKVGYFVGDEDWSVFPKTGFIFIFLLYILYVSSYLCLGIVIIVACKSVATTLTVTTVLHLVFLMPFEAIMIDEMNSQFFSQMVLSTIICHTAFTFGINDILVMEAIDIGVTFDNLFAMRVTEKSLSLGYVFCALILNCLLLCSLAVFIKHEKGLAKLTTTCRDIVAQYLTQTVEAMADDRESQPICEKIYVTKVANVKVINISKILFPHVEVLHNICLTAHENQITAIIGNHHSGVSLLASIICGLVEPTSGVVEINGELVTHNSQVGLLGFHQNDSIINEELSIDQHFDLYCGLRNLTDLQIELEKLYYYRLLFNSDTKFKKPVRFLSYAERRKLNLALAFCGGTSIVVLDSPTIGIDTANQILIWNLINSLKHSRTIILTTHSMDEAEELGDVIAIIDRGRLQCRGSQYFLRKLAGACYYLYIDVDSKAVKNDITNLLRKHIGTIGAVSSTDVQVVYGIGFEYSHLFPKMLSDLEEHRSLLRLKHYTLSVRSLDQMYMRIEGEIGFQGKMKKRFDETAPILKVSKVGINVPKYNTDEHENIIKRRCQTFQTMFLKRYLLMKRYWRKLFLLLLFLIFLHILILYLSSKSKSNRMRSEIILPIDFDHLEVTKVKLYSFAIGDNLQPFYTNVIDYLNSIGVKYEEIKDFTDHFSDYHYDPFGYNNVDTIEFKFEENVVAGYISRKKLHTAPLMLNFLFNAYLQNQFSIKVSNHPLPASLPFKQKEIYADKSFGRSVAYGSAIIMSVVVGMMVLFYTKERTSKKKHLHFVSGITSSTYWCSALIFDFIIYHFVVLMILFVILLFQKGAVHVVTDLAFVYILLLSFGSVTIPIVMFISQIFSKQLKGYNIIIIYSFIGTTVLYHVFYTSLIQKVYKQLIFVLPQLVIWTGIVNYYSEQIRYSSCLSVVEECMVWLNPNNATFQFSQCWNFICSKNALCCAKEREFFIFETTPILKFMAVNFIIGTVSFFFVYFIDFFKVFRTAPQKLIVKTEESNKKVVDRDVADEEDNFKELDIFTLNEYALIVSKLVLKGKKNAGNIINGISMGVKPYECFGILGAGLTGKTDIFKMFIGLKTPNSGDIYICGSNFFTNKQNSYELIGYCPQEPVMYNELTGSENVRIFGMLRGMTDDEIITMKRFLSRQLEFEYDIDRRVQHMNHNCKAKLALVIALVASPAILYLDQPTSGMDPIGRRLAWRLLNWYRERGKALVLMTHSLTECEELCTRIAIISNGDFKCLGSVKHLKQKLTRSVIVTVVINRDYYSDEVARNVDAFIKHNFPACVLREQTLTKFTYNFSELTGSWSRVFKVLEAGKAMLPIKEYFVGQSSLDQIYYKYSKLEIKE